MSTISINCSHCGKPFEKHQGEYNRQVRNKGTAANFYCGDICSGNARRKVAVFVSKQCKCGKTFETATDSSHCSTRCASLYSMTPERLAAMTAASANTRFQPQGSIGAIARSLAVREADKYESVDSFLLCHDEVYQFEFHLSGTNYIFDLALPQRRLFIEFDESHHSYRVEADAAKTKAAEQQGWTVHRIDVAGVSKPYPYELIYPALYGH